MTLSPCSPSAPLFWVPKVSNKVPFGAHGVTPRFSLFGFRPRYLVQVKEWAGYSIEEEIIGNCVWPLTMQHICTSENHLHSAQDTHAQEAIRLISL